MSNPLACQKCNHLEAHSAIVGCLADDCDCPSFVRAPKTLEDARQERDQAMAQAEAGTSPDWEAHAVRVITELVELEKTGALPSFTPDDIWDRLEAQQVEPPREPRALGPILKRLARSDFIRPSGFTESRRRHSAPVRLYVAGAEA